MAASVLLTVEFETVGGDPLDRSHNSFCFAGPGTAAQVAQDSFDIIHGFYDTSFSGSTNPVGAYLGPQLSRVAGAMFFRAYDLTGHLDGSPHGAPILQGGDTLVNPLGTALPEGIAIAVSVRGDYGTDVEFGPPRAGAKTSHRAREEGAPSTYTTSDTRPRARDRGRVFLGPVGANAMTVDSGTNRARVATVCRTDLANAAKLTATAVGTHGGGQWCVWSRVGAAVHRVTAGWVDDRFDYQRRREDQGLIRTAWAL